MRRKRAKRSSRVAVQFFWQIAEGSAEFLQELANLHKQGVARFEQKYEPSFDRYTNEELLNLRDELRALWTGGKQMPPSLAAVWDEQKAAATGTQLNEFICNRWLRASRGGLVILMGGIQPDVHAPLALVAYCAHLRGDKMRICCNENCPAPYFIGRIDQRFCSPECAAPANRAAKLRSWRKHKDQWPSQLKRIKSSRRNKQ